MIPVKELLKLYLASVREKDCKCLDVDFMHELEDSVYEVDEKKPWRSQEKKRRRLLFGSNIYKTLDEKEIIKRRVTKIIDRAYNYKPSSIAVDLVTRDADGNTLKQLSKIVEEKTLEPVAPPPPKPHAAIEVADGYKLETVVEIDSIPSELQKGNKVVMMIKEKSEDVMPEQCIDYGVIDGVHVVGSPSVVLDNIDSIPKLLDVVNTVPDLTPQTLSYTEVSPEQTANIRKYKGLKDKVQTLADKVVGDRSFKGNDLILEPGKALLAAARDMVNHLDINVDYTDGVWGEKVQLLKDYIAADNTAFDVLSEKLQKFLENLEDLLKGDDQSRDMLKAVLIPMHESLTSLDQAKTSQLKLINRYPKRTFLQVINYVAYGGKKPKTNIDHEVAIMKECGTPNGLMNAQVEFDLYRKCELFREYFVDRSKENDPDELLEEPNVSIVTPIQTSHKEDPLTEKVPLPSFEDSFANSPPHSLSDASQEDSDQKLRHDNEIKELFNKKVIEFVNKKYSTKVGNVPDAISTIKTEIIRLKTINARGTATSVKASSDDLLLIETIHNGIRITDAKFSSKERRDVYAAYIDQNTTKEAAETVMNAFINSRTKSSLTKNK